MDILHIILTTVIPTIAGLLGGGLGTWIIMFYKERKIQDIAANDQAVKIYKEVVDGVRLNFDKLDIAYNTLHHNYLDAKIELAKSQVIIDQLRENQNHSHN